MVVGRIIRGFREPLEKILTVFSGFAVTFLSGICYQKYYTARECNRKSAFITLNLFRQNIFSVKSTVGAHGWVEVPP